MATAVLIDGPNLYAAAKALNFVIDYKKLRVKLKQMYPDLLRIYYFTAVIYDDNGHSSLVDLLNWLSFNGYTVKQKEGKRHVTSKGLVKVGNMDIEIALEAFSLVDSVDTLVLVSGDGDFIPLVEFIQRKGTKVDVMSSMHTNPTMIGDALRKQCDTYIELSKIMFDIARSGGDELPG